MNNQLNASSVPSVSGKRQRTEDDHGLVSISWHESEFKATRCVINGDSNEPDKAGPGLAFALRFVDLAGAIRMSAAPPDRLRLNTCNLPRCHSPPSMANFCFASPLHTSEGTSRACRRWQGGRARARAPTTNSRRSPSPAPVAWPERWVTRSCKPLQGGAARGGRAKAQDRLRPHLRRDGWGADGSDKWFRARRATSGRSTAHYVFCARMSEAHRPPHVDPYAPGVFARRTTSEQGACAVSQEDVAALATDSR